MSLSLELVCGCYVCAVYVPRTPGNCRISTLQMPPPSSPQRTARQCRSDYVVRCSEKSAIQRRSGISATYSLSGWAEQKRNWDKHLLEKQMPFIPEIENLIKNLNLIHHLDSWKKVTSNQKWEKHLWGNRQLGRVRWTWKCGESQWHFDDLCRRNWYRLPGSLTSPDALIHQSPRTSWT